MLRSQQRCPEIPRTLRVTVLCDRDLSELLGSVMSYRILKFLCLYKFPLLTVTALPCISFYIPLHTNAENYIILMKI